MSGKTLAPPDVYEALLRAMGVDDVELRAWNNAWDRLDDLDRRGTEPELRAPSGVEAASAAEPAQPLLRPAWAAESRAPALDPASLTPRDTTSARAFAATASWLSSARVSAARWLRWLVVFALGLGAGIAITRVFGPATTGAEMSAEAPTATGSGRTFELILYDTASDGRLLVAWVGGGECPTSKYRIPQNLAPNAWNKATSYLLHADCPISLFESPGGGDRGERLIADGVIHTLPEVMYRRSTSVVAYRH